MCACGNVRDIVCVSERETEKGYEKEGGMEIDRERRR